MSTRLSARPGTPKEWVALVLHTWVQLHRYMQIKRPVHTYLRLYLVHRKVGHMKFTYQIYNACSLKLHRLSIQSVTLI